MLDMYSSYPVDLCSEWNEGKRMRGGERSGEKITSVVCSELYCVCAHKTKVSM